MKRNRKALNRTLVAVAIGCLTLLIVWLFAPTLGRWSQALTDAGGSFLTNRHFGSGDAQRGPERGPVGDVNATRMQEVAPPGGVEQLRGALAQRQPTLRVLSPLDDSLLPEGPWTLKLGVKDWPLVDAGPLGLGPHVVVQLDGEPPRRITDEEVLMPPLRPGSHRLTVYAARPWGEVVKSPGATHQIRLHRLARNPRELPAEGSPQLLAVSPPLATAAEPMLLDWLLLDAPLQGLRPDDEAWRLRVRVNGEEFLLDRQTPLWLKGWKPGINVIQLELLDGRGDPLNPPFNSLVIEANLLASLSRPPWLAERMDPTQAALLLGEAPLETASPEPIPLPPPSSSAAPTPKPVEFEPGTSMPEPKLSAPAPGSPAPLASQENAVPPSSPPPTTSLVPAAPSPAPVTIAGEGKPDPPAFDPPDKESDPVSAPPITATDAGEGERPAASLTPPTPSPAPAPAAPRSVPSPAIEASPPDAQSPSSRTDLEAARDQVNPDGTLIRPPSRGPLARLRELLGK